MKTLILITFALSFTLLGVEVKLETEVGMLKGTLEEIPENKSQIVFIIPGSGPTDRDGNSAELPGKNNSLKYLAEFLYQKKIPSLRIDKRGIGGSTSPSIKEKDLRFETYINDVVNWIRYLKQQGYSEVFVLGHSEGSLVGMLAAQKEKVAGFITVSGPSKKASILILEQLQTKLPPQLLSEAEEIINQLNQGKQIHEVSAHLAPIFRPSVQPYLSSWFKYDPSAEIEKLNIPILILQGTTDIQVSPKAARSLHQNTLKSTLRIIEGMNHVLKDVDNDLENQISSYSDPKLPINRQLGMEIATFVGRYTK